MEAAQQLLLKRTTLSFQRPIPTLAASSATAKEIAEAKRRRPDGTGPVEVDKRPYRPKMPNDYIEPEFVPDEDTLDVILQSHGTVLLKAKEPLPPRDDVIKFDPATHEAEFQDNIQWDTCPVHLRPQIESILKEFWDVFVQEGLRRNIRGYSFNVDTGPSKPICCKVPRYGPHESRVITNLTNNLEANGLIEDDHGPWGALVILAGKPYQDHKHWSDYIFRLCVSFRPLNRITRPFTFPSRRCDDAVTDIGPAQFFITMDLDSGYWQVSVVPESREKLAFFVPDGKKHWTVMPLGATNAHPCFCAMMAQFRRQWDQLATDRGIQGTQTKFQTEWSTADHQAFSSRSGSEAIVDDVLIYSTSEKDLLAYFRCVLEVLQFYRATVKLKKCRFCPQHAEFVGLDLTSDGNQPADSKMKFFHELELSPPKTMTDLRHFIGLLGFYQQWIPLYEVRIRTWRDYQALCPPGTATPEEEANFLQNIWTHQDEALRLELLSEIKSKPSLVRPDYNRRFYLKTDWCKHAMAGVLLQADPSDAAAFKHELTEQRGGPCTFDSKRTPTSLRLLPLAYISRRTTTAEQSYHSYIGEASTGVWAIRKFQRYLLGPEFTWMTDCSGLTKFLDSPDLPTHATQRWRQFLLRFAFTVVHRPDRMMKEVDTLSRYNQATATWRNATQSEVGSIPIATSSIPIHISGPTGQPPSRHMATTVQTCSIIILNAATSPVRSALEHTCFFPHVVAELEDRSHWNITSDPLAYGPKRDGFISSKQFVQQWRAEPPSNRPSVDWIVALDSTALDCADGSMHQEDFMHLVEFAAAHLQLKAALWISAREARGSTPSTQTIQHWCHSQLQWESCTTTIRATHHGAAIDGLFRILLLSNRVEVTRHFQVPTEIATPMLDALEFSPPMDEALHLLKPVRMAGARIALDEPRQFASLQAENSNNSRFIPVFDPMHPAPSLADKSTAYHQSAFVLATPDDNFGQLFRGITQQELFNLLSLPLSVQDRLRSADQLSAAEELSITIPAAVLTCIFEGLFEAATPNIQSGSFHKSEPEHAEEIPTQLTALPERDLRIWLAQTSIPIHALQRPSAIPLPSKEQWVQASLKDPDLQLLFHALNDAVPLNRDQLVERRYHDEWKKSRFKIHEGLLVHLDLPKQAKAQHIFTRVVPPALRQLVFAAYHSSPLAGHMGLAKTYHRIATRYWWPTMATDIRRMTLGCAHCRAVNAANHEAQQILKSLSTEQPFDIIFLDVWSPGKVPPVKPTSASVSSAASAVLTCLCGMTAFAAGAPLASTTSEEAAKTAFQHFFVTRGLPRLIIIDQGSEFAGYLIAMCRLLAIEYYPVTKENHKAILNERFHRYLNKVQRLHALDCRSFSDWLMGLGFALYAWNSAPIDGTDIIRSFAALGRTFPFPLDLQSEPVARPANLSFSADQINNHLVSSFPLLAKQRELLSILIEDRRQKHAALKNAQRNPSRNQFQIGDLVLVRKQVQSSADKGPAKLMTRARGPYRVLQEIHPGTYLIQKLPLSKGQGRVGKPYPESAARLEILPSTLLLHPQTHGTDNRLAYLHFGQVPDPLSNIFGADDFGSFQQADERRPYAYDRIADLWPSLDSIHLSDSDDQEDHFDNDGNPNHQTDDNRQVHFDGSATREHSSQPTPPSAGSEPLTDSRPAPNQDANAPVADDNAKAPNAPVADNSIVADNSMADNSITFPPVRRSSRRSRLPSRFQPSEFHLSLDGPHTKRRKAAGIKANLASSTDRMCFLKWPRVNSPRFTWRLAQIVSALDEINGIYSVHLYIAHRIDSSRKALRHCRFWPEIRRIDIHNNPASLIPVSPSKVTTFLQRNSNARIISHDIDLTKTMIVGPFNFMSSQTFVVPPKSWRSLINSAPNHDCDVNDLDSIIPSLLQFSDWVQCEAIPIHTPTDDLWSRRTETDVLYFSAKVDPPACP